MTMYTITEPDLLVVSFDNSTNVSCNSGNDGAINVTVSGGVMPYSYAWSTATNANYATAEDITNLPADTYSLVVIDANGAVATLMPDVIITEPLLLEATATAFEVSCNAGSDGSITATAMGGTPPYSYAWSNGAADNSQNFGLTAGMYAVIVTDANGCTTEVTNITVNEPTPIMLSGIVTDATFFGGLDGEIDLTATGGTSPYSFDWDNDNIIGDSDPEDLDNLAAGTYIVIVTDANGCTETMSFDVEEPDPLVITVDAANDPLCNGDATGNISVSVMGGIMPYTYLWDNGATTEDITDLAVGTYTLIVTDANNITQTSIVVLTEPAVLTESAVVNPALCFGGNEGSIQITVGGGTPPYSYNWSNGVTTSANINLIAGNYDLTITDANGCLLTQNYTITEPTEIAISGVETHVTIFGDSDGAIDLTVTNGTPGYTFLWSNGATTEDLNTITAGDYAVTVTDANGCTQTAMFTITEPTQLVVSFNASTNVSCTGFADGTIDIDVMGAVSPYTFLWSNGATTEDLSDLAPGTYQVTVTDTNGALANLATAITITEPTQLADNPATITNVSCNGGNDGNITMNPTGGTPPYSYLWANGLGTNPAVNNLPAGTYTVTITDANGCFIERTNTVTEPAALTVSGVVTDVTIFGQSTGAVDITVAGGTLPYAYSWSNGAITEDISNLNAGDYTVTITDANDCMLTETYTITEPEELLVATNTTIDPSCNGFADGSLSVAVMGGVMPYTFDWDNDGTGDNDDTAALTDLLAGTYNLTVTDANGAVTTHVVVLDEPTVLTSSETTQDISCFNGTDGSITVTGAGATPPYSIAWSNGVTTLTNSNLTAGTYSYTLTDSQGCTVTGMNILTEPTALAATETIQEVSCPSGNDGQISIAVTGGTPPYTYSWNTGATTNLINTLAAGIYDVTVTDANNCTLTATYTINEPAAITIDLVSSSDANCGQSDGSITVEAMGGTAPYTYQWVNPSVSGDVLNTIPAGTYEVIVTDANSCTESAMFSIIDVAGPILAIASQTNIDCFGESTGAITTTLIDGTAPFSYVWSNGATTADISNLPVGTYLVTLTDAVGCTATASTTLTENTILTSNSIPTNVSCYQGTDGSADLFVNGGVTPYSYTWSNGTTNEDLTGVSAGTYEVTVTDAVGCTLTNTVTLTEPTELINEPAMITNVSCNGGSDGNITVAVSGGTAPYSYFWSNGLGINATVNNLPIGTYSVTITDANNCSIVQTNDIIEPNALSVSGVVTDVAIFGQATGAMVLQQKIFQM